MHYIGIDPGWSGGFAIQHPNGVTTVEKMGATELDIWSVLRPYANKAKCWLELVHAMGTNGCKGNFELGRNKGALRCALQSLDIPILEVSPVAWMRPLQPLTRGDGKNRTKRKQEIKEAMKKKYPDLGRKITNATADALAILDYGLGKEREATTHN